MAGGQKERSVFAMFWANASYKSFAKPQFREAELEEPGLPLSNPPSSTSSNAPSPSPPIPSKRQPSTKLTLHQFLYLAGSHGIGAAVISGGMNFAIAYRRSIWSCKEIFTDLFFFFFFGSFSFTYVDDVALSTQLTVLGTTVMYTSSKDVVRLFALPNTLAGDTAVTIILQTIITWLLESLIVNRDLQRGNIQPIGFIRQPGTTGFFSRLFHWFLLVERSRRPRASKSEKAKYVVAQVLRAFLVAVMCFCILFGPVVGVMIAVGNADGGDWDFEKKWAPEVFKLVLGFVLALMTSPFFAMLWMVKCGWDGGSQEKVTTRKSRRSRANIA